MFTWRLTTFLKYMRNRTVQSEKAFTLLELLVAMSIMAVITAALYSTLHLAFRAKDSVDRLISPIAAANAVFDVIRSDLACAVDPSMNLSGPFVGEEAAISDNSSISFYTSNYMSEDDEIACDIYQVEYALEKYDQWEGYALVKNSSTNLLSQSEVVSQTEVLCRGVYSLDIEYYDGVSWTTSWDSENMTYTLLPPLVKITMEMLAKSDDSREQETVRVIREFLVPQPPEEEQQ